MIMMMKKKERSEITAGNIAIKKGHRKGLERKGHRKRTRKERTQEKDQKGKTTAQKKDRM